MLILCKITYMYSVTKSNETLFSNNIFVYIYIYMNIYNIFYIHKY